MNAKENRRLELRRKFKAVSWFLFFGPSYMNDISKKVVSKKPFSIMIKNNAWEGMLERYKPVYLSVTKEALEKIYKSPGDYNIVSDVHTNKNYDLAAPNSSDVAKHTKEIYAKIVVLISAIIKVMVKSEGCITDTMENDLKNFEEMISDREFLMEKTYFGYELHRINFDTWGRFKGVTKPVRQMCVLGYWLVRMFIFEILMKPWEIGICKDSKPCRFTARIFCSI